MNEYKYALFGYSQYYPCGGFNDFVGKFNTKDELVKLVEWMTYENFQIVDIELFTVIHTFAEDDYSGINID